MKILDPGHCYELAHLDGDESQQLIFVKREGENYPGNFGHYEGTTCQEVIRVLIDRCQYLQNQKPCFETFVINKLLMAALFLFEFRHSRIKGKFLWTFSVNQPICPECGHVQCDIHGASKSSVADRLQALSDSVDEFSRAVDAGKVKPP